MTKRQFIADYIINAIKNGEFVPGQKLESEEKMSHRFGVSVVTIKNALDGLVNAGYLRRAQGAGTFVAPLNSDKIPISLSLKGFHDNAKDLSLIPEPKALSVKKIIPPPDIRQKLQIDDVKEKVIFYERINIFGGTPVSVEQGYLKMGFVPDIKKRDLETSRYRYYAENGCPIVRVRKTIIPVVPEKRIAEFLNIKGRPPLQMVENISYNQKGEVTDFTIAYYNPDKYILESDTNDLK